MIKKTSDLGKNYIFNLIVTLIEAIIPIITTPILSRILMPDGIGIYSYTFSIVTMFMLTGGLGTATHAQRIIAMDSDNKDKYSKVFYEIFFLRVIFLGISLILFLVIASIYTEYRLFLLLQIPYFISAILDIEWLYQGLEKFKNIALKNGIFKILGVVLIFLFISKKEDLWLYILILSSTQLLGNLSLWLKLKKIVAKVNLKELNLKKHLKEVMVYFVPTIAYQFYALIDKVILGAFSSEEETGFYEQANKIINMCMMFLNAYTLVIRSRMAYLFAKKDVKAINQNIDLSIRFILLIALPISFGIICVSFDFVPFFFGMDYDKVKYLLIILAPIILIISLRSCIESIIFTPFGLQAKSNIGQVCAAIFNCIATLLLIPWLGSYGAAISSILAELIILVYFIVYCWKHKYLKVSSIFKLSYKSIISALIMLISVFGFGFVLRNVLELKNYLCFIIEVVLGVLIYFIALLLLKDELLMQILSQIKKFLHTKFNKKEANLSKEK